MRFQFRLTALAEVAPWGGKSKKLHWFGLTDGWFWVGVGEQELFRYSQAVLGHWARLPLQQRSVVLPYGDYPVVRYWEDLLDMLPAVLDSVPGDLAERVADHEAWTAWQEQAQTWMEQENTDSAWDTYYMAVGWWDARRWYSHHLSYPPRIRLWRVADAVHVCWDNRDVTLDGLPVWEAELGETTLPVADFRAAVADFHARLMTAMGERVTEARRAWPFPDVEIDLDYLEWEQRERLTWLDAALKRIGRDYEWDEVREAMARIQAEIGG